MVTDLKNAGIDTTLAYEAKFINKKIMGITRNAEKVNSKSGLLVNSKENLKQVIKNVVLAEVKSPSMVCIQCRDIPCSGDIKTRKIVFEFCLKHRTSHNWISGWSHDSKV